ncbi:hypothetical protein EIK56_22900 [Sphingomonas sp. C8-2]|nr:hypothetical protein EIK56_22900 [Sphingomonas sp. C8-2]
MATTSWKFPGTVVSGVSGETGAGTWANTANVAADDNAEAVITIAAGGKSSTLRASNFGFTSSDIPAGTTITGVEVEIQHRSIGANPATDYHVQLVPNGAAGLIGDRAGDDKALTAANYPTNYLDAGTIVLYGSPTDTWSAGLTRAQALSSTFGVDFQAQSAASGGAGVDYIRVRLTYQDIVDGDAAITEGADAVAGAGTVKVKGTAAIVEAGDASAGGSAFVPARDWDFRQGALPAEVAFTRASYATLVDQTGKIAFAPANLFVRSQEFDSGSWVKGNLSVTADATTAPDGSVSADKLVEAATSSTHYVQQNVGTVGLYEVLTVYAKPAGRDWIGLNLSTANAAYFNVAAGTVGTVTGAGAVATITPAANGFYRCSLRGLRQTSGYNAIFCCAADNAPSYAGDGTSGVYLWGAQLEPVGYMGSARAYLMTTTAAFHGARFSYHPVTWEARGLLNEEARSNLASQSEFVNGVADAPTRGSVTAAAFAGLFCGTGLSLQLVPATTVYAYKTVSTVAGTIYTLSVFVRMDDGGPPVFGSPGTNNPLNDFVLNVGGSVTSPSLYTIEDYGGGLYRVWFSAAAASDNAYAGVIKYGGNSARGFSTSGWQFEAGSFPTSYIPTGASAATRAAEQLIASGASFTGWFNPDEGTIIVDFETLGYSTQNMLLTASDGTNNNLIEMRLPDAANTRVQYTSAGTLVASLQHPTPVLGVVRRLGTAYKLDDFASVLDGGAPLTDNAGAVPTGLDRLGIGNRNGSFIFNGHIRRIRYFNQRLSNALLQTFTKPITGTGTSAEANDNAAGTGRVKVKGQAAIVEGDDVSAGAGETGIHLVTPAGRIAAVGTSRLSNRTAR